MGALQFFCTGIFNKKPSQKTNGNNIKSPNDLERERQSVQCAMKDHKECNGTQEPYWNEKCDCSCHDKSKKTD